MLELGKGFSFTVRASTPTNSAMVEGMLRAYAWEETRKRLQAVGLDNCDPTMLAIFPEITLQTIEGEESKALAGWSDWQAQAQVKLFRMV